MNNAWATYHIRRARRETINTMNSTISRFPYILDNIDITTPWFLEIGVGSILALLLFVVCRYAFLYMYGLTLFLEEKHKFENKKHILWDLILMKDIQTELESEIEKAMLKSTFQ